MLPGFWPVALADRFDAHLSLVTVIESGVLDRPGSDGPGHEALDDRCERALDQIVEGAEQAGVPCETAIRTGRPSEWDSVLVPTDGSDCAARVREHALAIADRYDATVHALSVVDVRTLAAGSVGGGDLKPIIDSITSQRERDVEDVRKAAEQRGIDCDTTVLQGDPRDAIEGNADEADVDLIVVGEREQTPIEQWLIRTPSQKLVRNSPVSVLTVCGTDDPVDPKAHRDSGEPLGRPEADR